MSKLNLEHSDKLNVVVLQRTVKKCTKNYNARAQPLLCSLNLLLSDIPAALAVVAILRPVYTGDFCSRQLDAIFVALKLHKFEACSKPLRYRGDKSH